ncbi:MAG: family 78 glycoside hydrolase catalytic domain, partial [Bacteroidota bacterium]
MSRLPLVLLMMLALALTACQVGPDPDTAPYGLQTEGAVASPLLNAGPPRFNWKMKPFEHLRGTRQSAYQLLVASSPALLRPGKADVWDSGQILSDQSVWVSYQGPALRSEQQYFWTVRVWDEQNGMSAWADPAHWYTGLEDWSAQWIGAEASGLALGKKGDDDVYIAPVATCLRRQIEIGEGLESAVLYATGVGAYVCQVDGERVGEKLLTPGWTDYPDRIMYQRYDITRQLTSGPHFLSATLGNAWWSSGLGWKGADVYSEGPLRFSATLVLTYADGKVERILTDPSWESTLAPHHVNTLYHGEHFDAGMELTGWQASSVHEAPSKQIVPQYGPDIIITDRLKPVSVTEVGPDTFIFDLGQNMVGRARLFVDGPAGTAVQLRFAEILKPDGRIYTENLRSARATDRYTLAGNGPENWAPEFTYHGFRYVEVTGFPGKPTTDAIVGEVFHSNLPKTFAFSSSNPLIDTLVRNIDWGLRGNVHSVPTDCPQRDERLGWTGDAQAFLPTASHMRYSYDFFRKWMQDIRDSQDSSGYVPDVNPVIVVNGPGKPGWADAVVVVPWQLFRYYGDTAILRENYAAMQAWVEYMNRERKEDYYYFANEKGDWFGYGDWVAPEASPGKPIGAAYHYYSTHLLG